jgi:hypothetical protein
MTREHCQQWLARYPVPHQIVRSACVFCPYKSNAEWRILKARNPAGWARAVAIDEAIRNSDHKYAALHRGRAFVHRSMVPLAQADLREKDERVGQVVMDFSQECQGMCGV